MSGFKIDNTRNQLRTLTHSAPGRRHPAAHTIENTKASVRTAYWNLRQAIEQIEIQRRSLDLAERLYQDNRTKVEIGTLAPIETTTSETQVANAEQALLNAQIQWRTAELTLKRLLASGPDDDVYTRDDQSRSNARPCRCRAWISAPPSQKRDCRAHGPVQAQVETSK